MPESTPTTLTFGGTRRRATSGLRSGIIGLGFIGEVHARAVRAAGGTLVAVADASPVDVEESARQLGAAWGAASAEELVTSPDVDVVHICTPNHLHATFVRMALSAGKHVICEKPLATSRADAAELVELARAAGVVAAVPFIYRYYPTVREARARVASGASGPIHLIHGSYLQDWLSTAKDQNWRVDPTLGGASRTFGDIGVHWCDLVEFATGQRITARGHRGDEAGRERGHPLPRRDLHEVAPVDPDVAEGARGATEGRVDAPVLVLGCREPVLEVRAVDEVDRTARAARDARPRLPDCRVVPVDERHGRDHAGRACQLDELGGVSPARRERLLADDVLPGTERHPDQRRVQVVRRADVHDIDIGRGHELLGGRGAPGGPQLVCRVLDVDRRRVRDRGQRPAGRVHRSCVDLADEAEPDDPGAQPGSCPTSSTTERHGGRRRFGHTSSLYNENAKVKCPAAQPPMEPHVRFHRPPLHRGTWRTTCRCA